METKIRVSGRRRNVGTGSESGKLLTEVKRENIQVKTEGGIETSVGSDVGNVGNMSEMSEMYKRVGIV